MNPYLPTADIEAADTFLDWWSIRPRPYNKERAGAGTRMRIALLTAMTREGLSLGRRFSLACADTKARERIARLRRTGQQQLCMLLGMKPARESMIEYAIGCERLCVQLAALASARPRGDRLGRSFELILLEDFDHVYRLSNLMDMERGMSADRITGGSFEIMPGRPSIAQHRHPGDAVGSPLEIAPGTHDDIGLEIITAVARHTLDTYLHLCCAHTSDMGRRLFQELAMLEEQHVTCLDSLRSGQRGEAADLLRHQWTQCYLAYSCRELEPDGRIAGVWADVLTREIARLNEISALFEELEGMDRSEVVPNGDFPPPLALEQDMSRHIRKALSKQAEYTQMCGERLPVSQLPPGYRFFEYQRQVNGEIACVPSHTVVVRHIEENGSDFRQEKCRSPIERFHNRQLDDTIVGREGCAAK